MQRLNCGILLFCYIGVSFILWPSNPVTHVYHCFMANIEFTVPYSHRYLVLGCLGAILQKWVPYSQRYLVLGFVVSVGLVGLVGLRLSLLLWLGLALWLVSEIALNKYCCEYGILNSVFATLLMY